MDTAQKVGAAAVVALVAVGGAVAFTGSDETAPAAAVCRFVVGEHGTFTVPDDDGRCDLVFERPTAVPRACEMQPVVDSSIKHQWSYDVTATGVIVRGLQRGESVKYECEERRDSP